MVRTGVAMRPEKNVDFVQGKSGTGKDGDDNVLSFQTFAKVASLQLVCASTVILGLWIVPGLLGINLIQQPVETLQILCRTHANFVNVVAKGTVDPKELVLVQTNGETCIPCTALALPVSLIAFSLLPWRRKASQVPAWWAILWGLLSLPVGALVSAFVALVFGAPLPLEYATKTLYWAALMSVLVVVPGATVLGSSWQSWHRIFANTEPVGPVEISICIPAHGAVIGAWFGAWPMPLDWERPWQKWLVCCTYGAVGGYLLSLIGSLMWTYFSIRNLHKKQD